MPSDLKLFKLDTSYYYISQYVLYSDVYVILIVCHVNINLFPTAPTMSAVGKEPYLSSLYSGDLYRIGSDKSCSTLIGRHKLDVVQMHVYQPLTQLWCVHLLNPAMQGLTERCRTQIFQLAEQCCTQNFYLRCFKSDTAYPGH